MCCCTAKPLQKVEDAGTLSSMLKHRDAAATNTRTMTNTFAQKAHNLFRQRTDQLGAYTEMAMISILHEKPHRMLHNRRTATTATHGGGA